MKALLAHRLDASDPRAAKLEWYTIVEGDHLLWSGVSEPYKVRLNIPATDMSVKERLNLCNQKVIELIRKHYWHLFMSVWARESCVTWMPISPLYAI